MKRPKLLFVDDEKAILKAIRRVLFDGDYEVDYCNDPSEAIALIDSHAYDVIITDFRMPHITGMQVLIHAREKLPDAKRILMTGYSDIDVIINAINDGNIFKYISKPWENEDLKKIIEEAVAICIKEKESTQLLNQVLNEKGEWQALVHDLENQIYSINEQGINMLMKVIESKDEELMAHSKRVANYGLKLAQKLDLNRRSTTALDLASKFHDIGKIAIRDSILYKPGELEDHEYDEMMHHPKVGAEILLEMEFMKEVAEIVYQHHERYNGSGYPEGLRGKNIAIEARIMGIADYFDALTSERSYKGAVPKDEVIAMLLEEKDGLFDAELVDIFVDIIRNEKQLN